MNIVKIRLYSFFS